jgi:hypothetical protein
MTLGQAFLNRKLIWFFKAFFISLSMNKDVDSFGITGRLSTEILI